MTTSIQKMQTNDLLHSSAAAQFVRSPHLLASDIHSQLNMLYAITQQQMSSSSPPDLAMVSKAKRIKKTIPTNHEPPSMVSATSSRSNSTSDREIVKVVTTAGPQNVDKEFLTQLLSRKDVIPARKRRDFIPNEMKDDHYWERRRKNNLAAKRSREKRRLNDIVLETKVVELSNENDLLRAKLHLMLSRLDMKETDMEVLFEEEQRLGHICLKPVTSASTILTQHQQRIGTSDDDEHSSRSTVPKNSSSSETHEDDDDEEIQENGDARCQHPILYNQLLGSNNNSSSNGVVDLSRTEVKTGNLLTTVTNKSPSPLTPSPSPPDESLLQILANQILKNKQSETMPSTAPSSRLLTIASPPESKNSLKRNFSQIQQDDEQQQKKWDEAAVTLLSLNKPPLPPQPVVEQQTALQSVCQSVINGLLRKPAPPRATIDYHSNAHFHHQTQHLQGENLHHRQQESITSLAQLKTLMNYFSTTSNGSLSIPSLLQQHQQQQQQAICVPENTNATAIVHSQQQQQQQHEHRGDAMPLKLRMKMLNAKS